MQLHVETCCRNMIMLGSQHGEEQHQEDTCYVLANAFISRVNAFILPVSIKSPQRKTLKQMIVLLQFPTV